MKKLIYQNILKDFNNNKDNKNIEELDNYGHKILKQTTQEILNLKMIFEKPKF